MDSPPLTNSAFITLPLKSLSTLPVESLLEVSRGLTSQGQLSLSYQLLNSLSLGHLSFIQYHSLESSPRQRSYLRTDMVPPSDAEWRQVALQSIDHLHQKAFNDSRLAPHLKIASSEEALQLSRWRGQSLLNEMGHTHPIFLDTFLAHFNGPEVMESILEYIAGDARHGGLHYCRVKQLVPCLHALGPAFFDQLLEADLIGLSRFSSEDSPLDTTVLSNDPLFKNFKSSFFKFSKGLFALLGAKDLPLFKQALESLQRFNVPLESALGLDRRLDLSPSSINALVHCLQNDQWDHAQCILDSCPQIEARSLVKGIMDERAQRRSMLWKTDMRSAEEEAMYAQCEKLELQRSTPLVTSALKAEDALETSAHSKASRRL